MGAISCRPSILRTISRPPASAAERKDPPGWPGSAGRVATSDFSGLVSSAWALAKAPAKAATDSLERGIGHLHQVKVHRPGFGALGPDAVADRLLGLVRHQRL